MRQDSVQRLQRINEAVVNLFEYPNRRRAPEMVTGLDGKQYPLGADPTRAQPGSALDIENKKKAAAGRPENTPGLRGVPLTAPTPAPRQAPKAAAPAAPKAQGNIQLPAAAATALGQGDAAMQAYVGQLDQGDPWRGQTKKPEATPKAAPAPKATTPNFVEITPEERSRVSAENAARQAAAPAAPQRGFNMGSLLMTGSTPPVITSPATSGSAAPKSRSSGLMGAANSVAGYNSNPQSRSSGLMGAANSVAGYNSNPQAPQAPKNAANLDPRFSTQPMDPDTGLPMSTTPKAVDSPKIEVGEGGPKLRPPVPQLPDSFVGNFTPPKVNTSPRAGTIQVARPAGDYSVGDPSRITYGGTPGKGTAGVGKTPVDAFGRPTGATRVFGTRYDEKGNVNPQGVYGSATDVTTAKPGEALTDFENFAGQMSLTNPLTWTRPTAALNRGISDTATWLSQKFSTRGDMTPKPGANNEAGIQYGITDKSRQDYFAAEKNRKQQSQIKYEPAYQPETPSTTRTVSENVNFIAPKDHNIKNKGSLENFLSGRG